MNTEAAIAFWFFVCTPAMALAFSIWTMARRDLQAQTRRHVILAALIGADFLFMLLGFLHYELIGAAYSPRRYATVICGLVASIALAVFASQLKSQARNSLFMSACLLAAIWLMNLGVSSVV